MLRLFCKTCTRSHVGIVRLTPNPIDTFRKRLLIYVPINSTKVMWPRRGQQIKHIVELQMERWGQSRGSLHQWERWRALLLELLEKSPPTPMPWSPTLPGPGCRLPGHSWGGEVNLDLKRQRLQSPLPFSAEPSQFVQWKGRPFPFWEGWRGWGQEQRLLRAGGIKPLGRSSCGGDKDRPMLFV